MELFDLSGRVALVTGASSGLGAAVARGLASAGARVALAARRVDRLEELADEIDGLAIGSDLLDLASIGSVVPRVAESLGGPEILSAPVHCPTGGCDASSDRRKADGPDSIMVDDRDVREPRPGEVRLRVGRPFPARERDRRLSADGSGRPARAGGHHVLSSGTGSSSLDVDAIRLRVLVPTVACRKVIIAG